MAGTINSLGVGSGILTADVIDQLREADEARIVKPLESKIELQSQKEEAFKLIDTLLTTFKSSVSQLGNDTLYQKRSVDVTSGNLEVTAEAGSDIESFTLETVALAKKNVQQSGDFGSRTEAVATGSGVLTVNGFSVSYTATTTLEELTQSINDEAGSEVTASILQTGEATYSLVLTSNETGAAEQISLLDTPDIPLDGGLVTALTTGVTSVQDAQDSEFKYNGITVTRGSNEISDLINGVTLTLKTEGETANVDIKQDTFAISTEMQLLVDSYNALQANIHDSTIADSDTGAVGVFNGDGFINSIIRNINTGLLASGANNNSLVNYGIDLDRDGVMSFDQSAFDAQMAKDPDATELFFTGGTNADTGDTVTGLFEALNDKINTYTKFDGLFDNYEKGMEATGTSLQEDRTRAIERLDSRYEILTKQFIAYDGLISKLNAQFSSLQLQIQAQANGDNN